MVLSYLGTCGVSIPLRAEARTRVGRPDCGRWRHGQVTAANPVTTDRTRVEVFTS